MTGLLLAAAFAAGAPPPPATLPRCAVRRVKVATRRSRAPKRRRKCRYAGWRQAPRRQGALPVLGGSATTVAPPGGGAPGGAAPPSTTPAPGPAPAPPSEQLPRRLAVDEGEWYVRASRRRVAAGNVEMNVSNFGEDPHDLAVERNGVGYGQLALDPGEKAQLLVDLPPGSYKLYCTLDDGGHEAAGMRATLEAVG
jgi:hypothetical protein